MFAADLIRATADGVKSLRPLAARWARLSIEGLSSSAPRGLSAIANGTHAIEEASGLLGDMHVGQALSEEHIAALGASAKLLEDTWTVAAKTDAKLDSKLKWLVDHGRMDGLRLPAQGTFSSDVPRQLDRMVERLKVGTSDSPVALDLISGISKLRNDVVHVIEQIGYRPIIDGKPVVLGVLPQPPLIVNDTEHLAGAQLGALKPGTRFNDAVNEGRVFAVDEIGTDGRVFYHDVDQPFTRGTRWRSADDLVHVKTNGTTLQSIRDQHLGKPNQDFIAQQSRELSLLWQTLSTQPGKVGQSLASAWDRTFDWRLASLSSNHITHDGAVNLDYMSERLKSAPRSPVVTELRTRVEQLQGRVSDFLSQGGERSIYERRSDFTRIPIEEKLLSQPAAQLAPGTRFKILPGSRNIYSVDAHTADQRVLYHSIDYENPVTSDVLAPDAVVKVSEPGYMLRSVRERLGQALYTMPPEQRFAGQQVMEKAAADAAERAAKGLPPKAEEPEARMTVRHLPFYKSHLQVTDDELNQGVMIDVGAGAQQELAREAEAAGHRALIISVDNGLGMPVEKDLARLNKSVDKQYRFEGWKSPHRLSVAANATQLPVADHSAKTVVSSFGLPYWARSRDEAEDFLTEMRRAAGPGDMGRAYPIRSDQTFVVENWLANNGLQHSAQLKLIPYTGAASTATRNHFSAESGDDYHLLTIKF